MSLTYTKVNYLLRIYMLYQCLYVLFYVVIYLVQCLLLKIFVFMLSVSNNIIMCIILFVVSVTYEQ